MKVSYLVDTDWIIDHFNKKEAVKEKLTELKPRGVAPSIISVAELYEGVHYASDPVGARRTLTSFLKRFPVLGLNQEICNIFGKERGKLRIQGSRIADFDLLIASTCLHHNLTLLTNNVKHFEQVEGLHILSLQQ